MKLGTVFRTGLLFSHLALAIVVMVTLWQHAGQRQEKVARDQELLAADEAELARRQTERAMQQARLQGLDEHDPYVVELLAREKYGYQVPGEIRPPPMPSD
jgi:cell division protein FtsB